MQRRLDALGGLGTAAWVLGRSGLLGPYRPDQVAGFALALARWGRTLGAVSATNAARSPQRVAVVDDEGSLTFAQMDRRTSTVAAGLADVGIHARSRVALLARNHRDFVTAMVALGKVGADTVYLNTGFAGPQLREVAEREEVSALITDEEFLPAATDALGGRLPLVVASGEADEIPSFAGWLAGGDRRGPAAPGRIGAQIILTSGTTGSPKGARRDASSQVQPLVSLLSRIPLRTGGVTVLAAPAFHAWGLANLGIGLMLGSTLVLARHFDPEDTLRLIATHRATALVAVPVMAQRMLELPARVRRRFDVSSLRVVALSGSALPGDLALRFMDAFGDVVYNLYGSTEIGWASIATPADLRAAPGTAGRVPPGTDVRLLDDDGRPVAPGRPGRIFVRSGLLFEGYSGGGGKDVVDGYMASGDRGHFDAAGRLFVDGREDDMIVSGGENVFPAEVEDLLAAHPAVTEAAVVGVDDERFGQRLKAFVVRRDGETVGEDDLKAYVRDHLARYKVPRQVEFVDRLPRNATGKVMKSQLT